MREGEQKKTLHRKQKLPFTFCILYMSVTFYTDTDIKTLVKCWYDATMTVYSLFCGLFWLRTAPCWGKNRRDSETLDEALLQCSSTPLVAFLYDVKAIVCNYFCAILAKIISMI